MAAMQNQFVSFRPRCGLVAVCGAAVLLGAGGVASGQTLDPAEPIAYQPIAIDFASGEVLSETSSDPSPFLDRRLQVMFTAPDGRAFDVPGFFAGDGTGATATSFEGDVWRVRFTPDEPGEWSWSASFRGGEDVAVELDAGAGSPLAFDGASGVFTVDAPDADAPGFFAKGRLDYVGEHYLQFRDGSYYIKGGADSPENWRGYIGFDNTFNGGRGPGTPSGLHEFAPHVMDWNPGDPDWDRTDPPMASAGRGVIGALNYLEGQGINSIYFLPMNTGGDAQDTWPYVGPINPNGAGGNDNVQFDISKLAQWDIVFNHAQAKGIKLHVVLNEAEQPNKRELDGGALGLERRLFYREMVARVGYQNALTWNISEEYNLGGPVFSVDAVKEFAAYLSAVDPYEHPLTVHNAGNPFNPASGPWAPFIGEHDFDMTSLQRARQVDGWDTAVADYRAFTADQGRPLGVHIDEPGSITRDVGRNFDEVRRRMMWDILLSGGGVEWFINDRDQSLEDFREFEQVWRETTVARRFIEDHLPFWIMSPNSDLVSGEDGQWGGAVVFAPTDGAGPIGVYLPDANPSGSIDLSSYGSRSAQLRWFDPRLGEFVGDARTEASSSSVPLGEPPSMSNEDWALLITPTPCAADLDGDGELTLFDFIEFQNLFDGGDLDADFDGDGVLTLFDFLEFQNAFDAGCP